MTEYTIKELGELVNSINKTADAAIEVSVGGTSGVLGNLCGGGLTVKITPQKPAPAPQNKTADTDAESEEDK